MSTGLLALLDDVVALAKLAAASLDDIATSTMKAGSKAAGIVIDDAAVTPKYVTGLAPSRELPIITKIGIGSLKNKLLFILPALLLMSAFIPWAITPLLMLGGLYLCFEGAEKVLHAIKPDHGEDHIKTVIELTPDQLEKERVGGAIRTDAILSAEIMTLSLSVIDADSILMRAITLAVIGVVITIVVYGSVALLVKIDDLGIALAKMQSRAVQAVGRGLVKGMPAVFKLLMIVGTAAMLWVGGNILTHGLDVMGWPQIYDWIHHVAETVARTLSFAQGFVTWLVTALIDGVLGLMVGLLTIPVVLRVIKPLRGRGKADKQAV